jgi:hypothetical protein
MNKTERDDYEQLGIHFFEEKYPDGALYRGSEALADALAAELPPSDPSFLSRERAAAWSHEASLRLADKNVSVTSPIPANGYTRTAMASASEREASRKPGAKQIRTRVHNHARLCASDANQPDATERAKETATIFKAMDKVTAGLLDLLSETVET